MIFNRKKESNVQRSPIRPWTITGISQFFYQNSSLRVAVLFTVIFSGYLFLVFMVKGAGFELPGSPIKSLGTSFGFDQADIIVFLSARSDEMIKAYISFNQVWDTIFGLTYGLMYVVWVSVLFKPISHKAGFLNLFPFVQVLFDWLENYELALLANQYLAEGIIYSLNAQLASVFSMIKWACSGLTYTMILIGLILMVARAITRRKQPG